MEWVGTDGRTDGLTLSLSLSLRLQPLLPSETVRGEERRGEMLPLICPPSLLPSFPLSLPFRYVINGMRRGCYDATD